MVKKLYKTGELAQLAGVSVRTIRYYDSKGILKPVEYSEAKYRLYDNKSVENLQKILMLKYVGFSLEQIEELMKSEFANNDSNLKDSLAIQKELLVKKIKHMECMIEAIENTEKAENDAVWEMLIKVINLTTEKEIMDRQYQNDENLQKRINIHNYSTASEHWMRWIYKKLNFKSNMKILEIGCGNGLLWKENIEYLPENITIMLTDNSEGMLEKVKQVFSQNKESLERRNIKYEFLQIDADQIDIKEKTYDVVIANHMLFHVNNRDRLFEKIRNGLKEKGTFYCSTIGCKHMKELNDFVTKFDPNIYIPSENALKGFQLENGREQLLKHFVNVQMEIQENDLMVDNADDIYEYVISYPGNAEELLSKKEKAFKKAIDKIINEKGYFYIHKSQGIFIAKMQ